MRFAQSLAKLRSFSQKFFLLTANPVELLKSVVLREPLKKKGGKGDGETSKAETFRESGETSKS
jgi:hypothetical protein